MFCPSHQTCSYEETGNSSLLLRKVQEYRNCVHDANVKGWLRAVSECDTFEDFGAYWKKKKVTMRRQYCIVSFIVWPLRKNCLRDSFTPRDPPEAAV